MTGEQLHKVVPTLTTDRAEQLAAIINNIAPTYKMSDPDILHEFIANVAHESGGFRLKAENMNYSAKRILQVWPKRFSPMLANKYAHNPAGLANYVYGDRMGNRPGTNDGWNFRGGGFIQLTGRSMYESYNKAVEFNDLLALALAVRNDDYYAMDSAFWLFAVEKKLIPHALADNFVRVVRGINGGTVGLTDRQAYYLRAKKYIV